MSPRDDDRSKDRAEPEPGPNLELDRTDDGLAGRGIPEPLDDPARPTTRVGRQRPCPNCGSRSVAAISYGLPVPSVFDNPGLGTEFVLGGCMVWPEMPMFHCHACQNGWRVSPPESGPLGQAEQN